LLPTPSAGRRTLGYRQVTQCNYKVPTR